jgi:hypothetical protein
MSFTYLRLYDSWWLYTVKTLGMLERCVVYSFQRIRKVSSVTMGSRDCSWRLDAELIAANEILRLFTVRWYGKNSRIAYRRICSCVFGVLSILCLISSRRGWLYICSFYITFFASNLINLNKSPNGKWERGGLLKNSFPSIVDVICCSLKRVWMHYINFDFQDLTFILRNSRFLALRTRNCWNI